MGIHDGHRDRMKDRFLKNGIDNFDEHNVLELVLCYSIPRGDVNPIAHELISRFGSLSAVMDAPYDELMKVDGVGKNTATLLKLLPQISRRYLESRASFEYILDTSEKTGRFLIPRYCGETHECVFLLSLDAKFKLLNCSFLGRGDINSTAINVRKVVETALKYNATYAVLSHNHTSGIALPSQPDEITTRKIWDALRAVDVMLMDHIVVADDDYVSMADNGFFR